VLWPTNRRCACLWSSTSLADEFSLSKDLARNYGRSFLLQVCEAVICLDGMADHGADVAANMYLWSSLACSGPNHSMKH
jgi:hypothetical protein